MGREIVWKTFTGKSRKEIFLYWNNRNKSRFYSNKLNMLFKVALCKLQDYNQIEKSTASSKLAA